MFPKRVWLADLLGPLRHLGGCGRCGRQFMSTNVFVWIAESGGKYCSDDCARRDDRTPARFPQLG